VSGIDARFFQKFSKDSTPPNNVVNIVESAKQDVGCSLSVRGIPDERIELAVPASVNGCGLDISIGLSGQHLNKLGVFRPSAHSVANAGEN